MNTGKNSKRCTAEPRTYECCVYQKMLVRREKREGERIREGRTTPSPSSLYARPLSMPMPPCFSLFIIAMSVPPVCRPPAFCHSCHASFYFKNNVLLSHAMLFCRLSCMRTHPRKTVHAQFMAFCHFSHVTYIHMSRHKS